MAFLAIENITKPISEGLNALLKANKTVVTILVIAVILAFALGYFAQPRINDTGKPKF